MSIKELVKITGQKFSKSEYEEIKLARKAGHEAKAKKDFQAYLKQLADGERLPRILPAKAAKAWRDNAAVNEIVKAMSTAGQIEMSLDSL